MQLRSIQEYLNYKQCLDEDPQSLLDEIIQEASAYLSPENLALIQETYEYSRDAHAGQVRLSGEAYIVHPVRSTQFLMHMRPDVATIQTCLLHDIIEDTPITYEEVRGIFGEEVATLCQGLVKVSKVKYRGEERQIETLKKTFLAMAEDLRVIFVKLVDRIHNIQTLQFHPKKEKRDRIIEETMKIYVPIAKRLGLYHYQLYLENGCFAIDYPKECFRILNDMQRHYSDRAYTQKGIKKLSVNLSQGGLVGFKVKGRAKSPYRVHQKLTQKYNTSDVSQVLDIIAFRIVTGSVGECYRALGMIHHEYTPMIHKIKDYISVPKPNGYQSLHTTILGLFNFPVEVQIRTQGMDDIAEYGVAAHFVYSDRYGGESISDSQSRWIKRLQEIVKTYQNLDDKEGFKQELNIEVLDKSKFIYTPKGDVLEMPANSTVLDFAFRIHSDVGLRFKNALVNGVIKPIAYIPATGDVVSINTFRNKEAATEYWMDFLNTPSARNKLQKFVKGKQKDSLISQSKKKLSKKLKERKLPLLGEVNDAITGMYSDEELDQKLMLALDKQISYTAFLREAYPKQWAQFHSPKKISKEPEHKSVGTAVIIDGDKRLPYTLCEMCDPQPKQRIIARTGKDGIKVHSVQCKGVKTVALSRLLESHRVGEEPSNYKIRVELEIASKRNNVNVVQLISMFADLQIAMDNISVTNIPEKKVSSVIIESEYANPAKIAFLLDSIKKRKKDFTVKKVIIG